MKLLSILLVMFGAAIAVSAQSDIELERDPLVRFKATKGASHIGQAVRWDIPAKALSVPVRGRGGLLLFVHDGVGVVVAAESSELAEVRRRGGVAVVRGKVVAVPAKERKPGDPSHVVVVRSLSYRRQSRPKK